MECCGVDRDGRFCSQCGKRLHENDILGDLLCYLRHTQAKLQTRIDGERSGPVAGVRGDVAKSYEKFKRWGDALESIVTKQPRLALLGTSIRRFGFGARVCNVLETEGVSSVGELTAWGADQLLALPNFGVSSLRIVRAELARLGLKLKGDETQILTASCADGGPSPTGSPMGLEPDPT